MSYFKNDKDIYQGSVHFVMKGIFVYIYFYKSI